MDQMVKIPSLFPHLEKNLFFPDIFLHGNPERISDYSLKYILIYTHA